MSYQTPIGRLSNLGRIQLFIMPQTFISHHCLRNKWRQTRRYYQLPTDDVQSSTSVLAAG